MYKIGIVLLASLFFTNANAACFGSSNMYSCHDSQSGNNYQVNKFGNTTYMTGNNSRTGSTWSQTSNTYGNTTYQSGSSSNGNTWNQTIQNNGSMGTTYSGTDSKGNYYSKTCNQFGCY